MLDMTLTGVQIEAIRKLMFLSRSQLAELLYITAQDLADYETGRKSVPMDIIEEVRQLSHWRNKEILRIDKATRRLNRKKRLSTLLWYDSKEDYLGPPENPPEKYLIYQSVVAEFVFYPKLRIIRFDREAFDRWREENGKDDTNETRTEWAELQSE